MTRKYGGVVPIIGVANRATWIVGKDGRIVQVITGSDAIDPTAAIAACSIQH